jgi:hypothetical protein
MMHFSIRCSSDIPAALALALKVQAWEAKREINKLKKELERKNRPIVLHGNN